VYVSDYPGKHNFDILRKLVLPDGSILRAQLPGRPTRDALFHDVLRDNKSLLKATPPPSPLLAMLISLTPVTLSFTQ